MSRTFARFMASLRSREEMSHPGNEGSKVRLGEERCGDVEKDGKRLAREEKYVVRGEKRLGEKCAKEG